MGIPNISTAVRFATPGYVNSTTSKRVSEVSGLGAGVVVSGLPSDTHTRPELKPVVVNDERWASEAAPAPLPFPVADTNTWSAAYAWLLLTTVTVNPSAARAGAVTAKPKMSSEPASDVAVRVLHMFANLGRPMYT